MVSVLERRPPPVGVEFSSVVTAGILSEGIIPAVPGEFYSYSSEFTEGKPLYVLMKCKANKARSIAAAEELGHEANLVFLCGDSTQARVCSIRTANASGLLGDSISGESFSETWIAPVGITAEDFYDLRSRKDMDVLVEICEGACSGREVSITLHPNAVIAMMTNGGKYGLFLVKGLASCSVLIDACHILL